MKVYVVTAGEYSDYHIVAVFSTKENALKFAEEHRNVIEGLAYFEDEIEEYEVDVPRVASFVEVRYNPEHDYVDWFDTEPECDRATEDRMLRENCFSFLLPISKRVFHQGLRNDVRKHLLKIAQDRYAKWKAEQSGIT